MASYIELYNLRDNSDLRNRVTVAVVIAATAIKDEASPSAARLAWANSVLNNPGSVGEKVIYAVLAENKDVTVGNITSATDAVLQTAVDGVVDLLVGE